MYQTSKKQNKNPVQKCIKRQKNNRKTEYKKVSHVKRKKKLQKCIRLKKTKQKLSTKMYQMSSYGYGYFYSDKISKIIN